MPFTRMNVDDLLRMAGWEHRLHDVNFALRRFVRGFDAPVVGALHIRCADESEWECTESFQKVFANEVLPELKFSQRAPCRLTNLGGRYEEGALRVAEEHYAAPETRDSFKVLLIKINAHVAIDGIDESLTFGQLWRYERASAACGALHATMDGSQLPFAQSLRASFSADGLDRLALLNDPEQIDRRYRGLYAALVNARMQARRVETAIREMVPLSPTLYVIVTCVTLNRSTEDSELFCGVGLADSRTGETAIDYRGLGDDPRRYRLEFEGPRLHVFESDDAGANATA